MCLGLLWKGGQYRLGTTLISNPRSRFWGAAVCLSCTFLFSPGMGTWKSRLAKLAMLFCSAGVAWVLLELGLRVFLQRTQGFNAIQQLHNPNPVGNLPTRSEHPLLVITRLSASNRIIYELKPNVQMSFGHRDLRINADGQREDRVYPKAKPEGVVRIVGVGDSGMWGWNVHQGEEYLAVLEDNLAKKPGPTVEVINFAVPGYNSFQEMETFRQKALQWQPDIVVVGWCENDGQLPFFMYTRKDHFAQKRSYLWAMAFNRKGFLDMVSPTVLKQSDIEDKQMVHPDVLAHAGDEGVEKSLAALKEAADRHGVKMLVFGPLKENIRNICARLGVATYNTYEKIDASAYPKSHAIHFMHPPKEGHAVLAEHLEQGLRELGWLP